MRLKVLPLLILWLTGYTSTRAQTVENVTAQVAQDGKVTITFDLKGDPNRERFKISVYGSHNSYGSPLIQITGDVSADFSIAPGAGKKVEWDASAELSSFDGELAFEVRAEVFRALNITKPGNGKSARRGSTTSINWAGGLASEKVQIELLKGGSVESNLGSVSNSGTYRWSIPKGMEKGKEYSIRLTSASGEGTSGPFAINAKFPMILKIIIPAAVIVGVIVLLKGSDGGSGEPLPIPPEPPTN